MCTALDGVVVRIDGATATVRGSDGVRRLVSLAPLVFEGVDVTPGDRLVVELGLAIARIGGDADGD